MSIFEPTEGQVLDTPTDMEDDYTYDDTDTEEDSSDEAEQNQVYAPPAGYTLLPENQWYQTQQNIKAQQDMIASQAEQLGQIRKTQDLLLEEMTKQAKRKQEFDVDYFADMEEQKVSNIDPKELDKIIEQKVQERLNTTVNLGKQQDIERQQRIQQTIKNIEQDYLTNHRKHLAPYEKELIVDLDTRVKKLATRNPSYTAEDIVDVYRDVIELANTKKQTGIWTDKKAQPKQAQPNIPDGSGAGIPSGQGNTQKQLSHIEYVKQALEHSDDVFNQMQARKRGLPQE